MDKLNRQLLALIGRSDPAGWDAITPHGAAPAARQPQGDERVGLSSQPIPPSPVELIGLNPKPVSPRLLGELLATEVIRMAQAAKMFGVAEPTYVLEGDWYCGTPPIIINPKKGPVGPSDPDTNPPVMMRDFHLGVASVLAGVDGHLAEHTLITGALNAHVGELNRLL